MTTAEQQADSTPLLDARAANLRRLVRLFSLSDASWALALYSDGAVRSYMVTELRTALAELPLVEVSLQEWDPDPLAVLKTLTAAGQTHVVVSFYGFAGKLEALCAYLDLQREQLAHAPQHLLIWLTPDERRALAELAPNFYSRVSSVFDFSNDALISSGPAPTGPGRKRAATPVDEADRHRRITYLEARIDELGALTRPDHNAIGDAWMELADLYEDELPNRWADAETAYSKAARAYAEAGKTPDEATARHRAGYVALRAYAPTAALYHLDRAQHLYRLLGDRLGEANTLKAQGDVYGFLKRNDEALAVYEQALALFRQVGSRLGEANTLKAQGQVYGFQDRNDEALAVYEQALALFRQVGSRLGEANTLQAQGDVYGFLKRNDEALAVYEQALGLFRQVGDRLGEANTLKAQGQVYGFLKRNDEALAVYEQALGLFRQVGSRLGEANTLAAIGQIKLVQDRKEEAERLLAEALTLYQQIGDGYSIAAQTGNYGWALVRAERSREALPYLQRAAELFSALGMDDFAERHQRAADRIRAGF